MKDNSYKLISATFSCQTKTRKSWTTRRDTFHKSTKKSDKILCTSKGKNKTG
jgi:hypothetical protein